MMFGREITLPLELVLGKPNVNKFHDASDFVYELESQIEKVHVCLFVCWGLTSEQQYFSYIQTNKHEMMIK